MRAPAGEEILPLKNANGEFKLEHTHCIIITTKCKHSCLYVMLTIEREQKQRQVKQ